MKKTLYSLLMVVIGFAACKKENAREETVLPVEATMTRTLDFTILGTEKDTIYTSKTPIKVTARLGNNTPFWGTEKNVFIMTIDAGPEPAIDGAGDLVQFVIEPAILKADYIGTYRFDSQSEVPLKHIRYGYISNKVIGAYSAHLFENNSMTGELNITKYDPAQKTVSGTYVLASKLYIDPTDFSRSSDLNQECSLTVFGTFSNIKIKQD